MADTATVVITKADAEPKVAFDPAPHIIQLPHRKKNKVTGEWTQTMDDYLEVRWRLVWFRDRYPHGTLETELLNWANGYAVVRAIAKDGVGGVGVGLGSCAEQAWTDYIEKAETAAVGRALAHLGFGTQFTAEDEKLVDSPVSGNGKATVAPGGKPATVPATAPATAGAAATAEPAADKPKAGPFKFSAHALDYIAEIDNAADIQTLRAAGRMKEDEDLTPAEKSALWRKFFARKAALEKGG